MAGATADEGLKLIADLIFLGSSVDAGATLSLGLFTNVGTIGTLKGLPLTSITEPTGGGYARKSLTRASFTRTNGVSGYALQTFTPNAACSWAVQGYFVATTGTTPRLLLIELDPSGAVTLTSASDAYKVTINDTVS